MLLLTYFFIAIGISFLCSILEAVILSITPPYIEVIKSKSKSAGKLLEKQKENIDESIGAILTLNTFAHTFGAAGVGAEAVKLFGNQYMFYISAILTLLILIFSEIIPKTIGAYYWKPLSIFSSKIIQILVFITFPLLYLMNKITTYISKDQNMESAITKEELEATVNMGEEAGILKQKDSLIIENILGLHDIKVKDIYTPRKVVFALEYNQLQNSFKNRSLKDIEPQKIKEYSRIPIFDKNIDDIIGIVLSKELFYQYVCTQNHEAKSLVKPVYKVNENIPVSKVIDLFIAKKEHMFIVTDKYDQTEGIVTLEDAIETLLGTEIVDELDQFIDMRALAKEKNIEKN